MVTEMRFCPSCGKPVGPRNKFCGSCGRPLTAPPAPAAQAAPYLPPTPQSPPQPAAPVFGGGETVMGVFLAARKAGMFSQEGVHIIVTGRRLVFAAFTNEMIKQAAKEEGKAGFLAGMVGAATVGYTYYKHYLTMSPDAALKENPQNFAVERVNLRRVKLEMGKKRSNQGQKQGIIHQADVYEPSQLEIETISEKYSFTVPNHFHAMAASVLRQAGLM